MPDRVRTCACRNQRDSSQRINADILWRDFVVFSATRCTHIRRLVAPEQSNQYITKPVTLVVVPIPFATPPLRCKLHNKKLVGPPRVRRGMLWPTLNPQWRSSRPPHTSRVLPRATRAPTRRLVWRPRPSKHRDGHPSTLPLLPAMRRLCAQSRSARGCFPVYSSTGSILRSCSLTHFVGNSQRALLVSPKGITRQRPTTSSAPAATRSHGRGVYMYTRIPKNDDTWVSVGRPPGHDCRRHFYS